jgi:nitrous oxidase accessory protein NosD
MYTEDYGPATLIVRDSHENVIEMNVIRGDVAAVAFDGVRDTHVHRNEMSSQGWGGSVVVLDRAVRTHFMANVLRGQASGIFLLSGQHNRLLSNTIRWEQDYGSCYRTGCDIDRIRVYPGARRTQIKRNLVHGYADDGIDVEDPTAHLRGNSVIGNRGYGIEAVPGVRGVDNSAVGGGCMNIDCRGTGDLIP